MLAFHVDMNFAAFRMETLKGLLRFCAHCGYDTVLWETEDKVRWENAPGVSHAEAMSKEQFAALVQYARGLGLKPLPLLQTIGHAEYVLRVPEYRKMREADSPDCYCTSSPEVRTFLTRLLDEMCEFYGDLEQFHIGGDEPWNFGRCPECASRPRAELYCEHVNALAQVLKRRGVQPCIWSDVLLKEPGALQFLDRTMQVWYWNYRDNFDTAEKTAFPALELLQECGFSPVLCTAASSAGDSPFLPRWRCHFDNIAGGIRKARTYALPGYCVTSWSVRQGLKEQQKPFLEGAARMYRGKTPEDTECALRNGYFAGADPEAFDRWDPLVTRLTGIMHNGYKDGSFPPEDHFSAMLTHPELAQRFRELPARLPGYVAALETACSFALPEAGSAWRRGAERQLDFLRAAFSLLASGKINSSGIRAMQTQYTAFLAREQLPLSAEHNSALVWRPLYFQSRIGIPEA